MKCSEFRQAYSAHVGGGDPALETHRIGCPPCQRFAEELDQLDEALGSALAVPVPPDLVPRLLDASSRHPSDESLRSAMAVDVPSGLRENLISRERRRRRWRLLAPLAAAASLALAVTLSLGLLSSDPIPPLAATLVEHVEGEPQAFAAARPLAPTQLRAVLSPLGIELRGELGDVVYASRCWIRRGLGAHLVLASANGPVTVFFMPNEHVGREQPFSERGQSGLIVPVQGGSIAVMSEKAMNLYQVAERARGALVYPAG